MNPQEVSDALRAVESYLVRQMIVGAGRAGSNVLLADLIRTLHDETPHQKAIIRILTGQRRRFPTNQQIREAMLNDPFYWRGKEWQKTFVLRGLDESIGRTELIDYDRSKLTIEHIMPQTVTKQWLQGLESDLDEFETTEEAHEALVHTIGNLTLSAYNGTLSNKSFEEKRAILSQSGLAMNIQIAEANTWGVSEIRERSLLLAEKAIEIWPGPDDSNSYEPENKRLATARQVLSQIPAGRWTNFLSLAQEIGTHRSSIGKLLTDHPVVNSHRVLLSNGSIPATSKDRQSQVEVLMAEGIRFDHKGRADNSQHIGLSDLIKLMEIIDQE